MLLFYCSMNIFSQSTYISRSFIWFANLPQTQIRYNIVVPFMKSLIWYQIYLLMSIKRRTSCMSDLFTSMIGDKMSLITMLIHSMRTSRSIQTTRAQLLKVKLLLSNLRMFRFCLVKKQYRYMNNMSIPESITSWRHLMIQTIMANGSVSTP